MLILLIFSLMKFIFNYLVDFFIIYSSMCYDSCVSLISWIYVNCSFLVNFIHLIIISPIWPIAFVWWIQFMNIIHPCITQFICPFKTPFKIWISLMWQLSYTNASPLSTSSQTILSMIHYSYLSKVMLHPCCHQQTLFFLSLLPLSQSLWFPCLFPFLSTLPFFMFYFTFSLFPFPMVGPSCDWNSFCLCSNSKHFIFTSQLKGELIIYSSQKHNKIEKVIITWISKGKGGW